MIILNDIHIVVRSVRDVTAVLQHWLCSIDRIDQGKEHFIALHLNTRSRVMRIEIVSIGIVNAAIVQPREVFRRAIAENTVSLIIAHNHPSGECDPSKEDIDLTHQISAAGGVIGIKLLDHIIFSERSHYSFATNGML